MRFYRTIPYVYEGTRQALDALWGHPKIAIHPKSGIEVITESCMPPLAQAVRDSDGMVLVALDERMAGWPEVQGRIEMLIQNGQVTEIDQETYEAAMPTHL